MNFNCFCEYGKKYSMFYASLLVIPRYMVMAFSLLPTGSKIDTKILTLEDTHGNSTSLFKFQRTTDVIAGGRSFDRPMYMI